MTILIGVPTHKRPQLLRACLQSLEEQKGDLPDVRVLVVDNDPWRREGCQVVADVASRFRFPIAATVVDQPGISSVRNAILAEARKSSAQFVAMLDDDETSSPNWLAELLRVHRDSAVDIVSGPVDYVFERPPSRAVLNSGMFHMRARATGETSVLVSGGNFLVATEALEQAGWPLFDPDFGLTGGEDLEWFARLSRRKLRFGWAADAIAYEHVPVARLTPGWVIRRAFRYGNSDVRVSLKEWPSSRLLISFSKFAVTAAASPLIAFLLLVPGWRLWALTRWARAAGRAVALTGSNYAEYAERH